MAQTIAIVTVHGTNDQQEAPAGVAKKWWEPQSTFCARLKAQLLEKGFEAQIRAHKWSGANSALGREQGAEDLAEQLDGYATGFDGLHVIGHSHGGNVANHAAELIGWGKRGHRNLIDSLTTVGTPYFKPNFGAAQYIGAIAFLVLTVASLVTLAVLTYTSFYIRVTTGDWDVPRMAAVVIIFVFTVLAYRLAFPLAMQGARRIRRFRQKLKTGEKIFSIWHPNDEAIAFLRRVERLKLEPFPKGALRRASRMPAILLSVRIVLVLVVIAVMISAASFLIVSMVNAGAIESGSWLHTIALDSNEAVQLLSFAFGGALILFSALYFAIRGVIGVLPELAFRGALNRWIDGLVRGMAFGVDTDQRLSDVSTVSHSHPSIERKLDGALAARMQTDAAAAATKLIEEYRWALFNVADSDNETLAKMAEDALTWDSLIHTTYFEHDEIADMIAAHIAAAKLD